LDGGKNAEIAAAWAPGGFIRGPKISHAAPPPSDS
jgi:hypothetical protein